MSIKHLPNCPQLVCGCDLLGKTPLTDKIRELGKQEPQQDFDISPIKEKVHDFITKGIYEFNS